MQKMMNNSVTFHYITLKIRKMPEKVAVSLTTKVVYIHIIKKHKK